MNSLAEIATLQVKSSGVFTIPGVCRIRTRNEASNKGREEGSVWQSGDGLKQGQQEKWWRPFLSLPWRRVYERNEQWKMDGEDSLGAPASSVYECHSRGIVDTLNDFLIKLKCNWMTHKELRLFLFFCHWTPRWSSWKNVMLPIVSLTGSKINHSADNIWSFQLFWTKKLFTPLDLCLSSCVGVDFSKQWDVIAMIDLLILLQVSLQWLICWLQNFNK